MIVDGRSLPPDQTLHADICIVGAGAAGITLACELERSGLQVIVLEAGGLAYDAALQNGLTGTVTDGSLHPPLSMYRRLVLGGATTIWGGRCVPLDPIDLARRDHVPHSGWPLAWAELDQLYARALAYCEAGHYAFQVADALGEAAPDTVAGFHDPDMLANQLERFSPPTNFGQAYLQRLTQSDRVKIVLMARAVRLDHHGSAVTAVQARTAPGRLLSVAARHTVLALGGLETTRLLLASDSSRRGGLGNQGGALGAFYMCHAENTLGLLRLNPARRPIALHFEQTADGVYVRRKFTLSAEAQQRERLLNTAARLHYPLIADPAHRNGVLSSMYLVKDVILPEYRRKLATIEVVNRDRLTRNAAFWAAHVRNVGFDAIGVARFGVDWLRRRTFARRKLPFVVMRSRDGSYPLDINAEQIPERSNTVSLGRERDADGVPRLVVNWKLTGHDIDSLSRSLQVMRTAFERSGCGTIEFDEADFAARLQHTTPVGGHHIGTARMADDPAQGVVDRHCAVHGLDNLHVASSAVFPTCGHANPTLTIVALAIRLAERVRLRCEPSLTYGDVPQTEAV